jgi:hypothetical protein
LLASWPVYENKDGILVVSPLIDLRCSWISNTVSGVGILYAMGLGARSKGNTTDDRPITSYEDIMKVSALSIDKHENVNQGKSHGLLSFLKCFGQPYSHQMHYILQKFVECSERLRLDDIGFHPPPRILLLEIVVVCKNIVESCIINLKTSGSLNASFNDKVELFTKCVQRISHMVASPWKSVDEAFASGCVYVACSKLIYRLFEAMESVKARVSMDEAQKGQGQEGMPEPLTNPYRVDNLDSMLSSGGWDLCPQIGSDDVMESDFDWSLMINVYPETEQMTACI